MWDAIFEMGLNMKKVLNVIDQTVTFTFGDDLASVVLAMKDVSPANATYAMLHGFGARIGDNAAIAKSPENNFTVTEAMRRVEIASLVEFYANADNPDWEQRKSTGPRKPAINPTWAKMAELSGRTYETIAAEMAERDIAELMAMTNMVAPRG